MTYEETKELWTRAHDGDDFLKFERVRAPRSRRPDLHAFLVLAELADRVDHDAEYAARNGQSELPCIVSHAEHDQIWLATSPEKIAAVLDEETIYDLVRCGVMFDENNGCLFMFA